MIEFAVRVKGLHAEDDGQATWVLAVDPQGGVLIVHEDKTLHWHPLADCTFAKLIPPDRPRPVFAVQPAKPANKPDPLVVPNRAALRALERNGPE
jgi:hypothetical protein